jgi:hypothetical protein
MLCEIQPLSHVPIIVDIPLKLVPLAICNTSALRMKDEYLDEMLLQCVNRQPVYEIKSEALIHLAESEVNI